MDTTAFVFSSSFHAKPFRPSSQCDFNNSSDVGHLCSRTTPNSFPKYVLCTHRSASSSSLQQPSQSRKPLTIAVVGKKVKSRNIEESVDVSGSQTGLSGIRANAYWESMGVLPLFFAGFGITALAIKLLKLKGSQLTGGQEAVHKMTAPKTAITSEAEEAELHVFKCGGCGYEIYPARGREFKFFPDSFKCPLCATPKSGFWDLNDPNDPRNQDDDEDENSDDGNGSSDPEPVGPTAGTAIQAVSDDSLDSARKGET